MNVTRAELWPYVRTAVEGGFQYDPVGRAPERLSTLFPPVVGDLFSLHNDQRMFRVVDRHWEHPQIGSPAWAAAGDNQKVMLVLILEEAETGLFVDEVSPSDED